MMKAVMVYGAVRMSWQGWCQYLLAETMAAVCEAIWFLIQIPTASQVRVSQKCSCSFETEDSSQESLLYLPQRTSDLPLQER